MKPHPWIVALPEWQPHLLPGYAEAVAKLERGESLFSKKAKSRPRPKRTAESLAAERDRLLVRRSLLYSAPDDPGMVSGIQRRASSASRKRDAATDAALTEHARLTTRIDYLNMRLHL